MINCLKLLTFLPIEEIEAMEQWEGSQLNKAKEILAYQLTEMVHGKEEADKALAAAQALFSGGAVSQDMPTTQLPAGEVGEGIPVLDLLVKTGLAPSKGEARRLVQQGGVTVDDQKVADIAYTVPRSAFEKGYVVVRKGKKAYHKAVLQ